MQAFQAALRPSRCLSVLKAAAFVWAAVLWLLYVQDGWRWVGLLLTGWAAVAALRAGLPVTAIAVDMQGRAVLFLPQGTAVEAELADGLVWPWLMLLRWETDGRRIHTALLPDMTDAEGWRRLQVWARWGRPRA